MSQLDSQASQAQNPSLRPATLPRTIFSELDVAAELSNTAIHGILGPTPSLFLPRQAVWEFPVEPIRIKPYQVCINPRPLTLRSNPDFSLFKGTTLLDIQIPYERMVDRFNLAHHRALPIFNRFLYYTESILQLRNIDDSMRAVGNSGSAGVETALKISRWHHEACGTGRRAVVGSVGVHSSAKKFCREGVECVPIDPTTRQMDTDVLIEKLRSSRAAALIVTIGRTDDGVIEKIAPGVVAFCRENGIHIILDLNLAALPALLPDFPLFPGDKSHLIKAEYLDAMLTPADMVVASLGKIIGKPGTSALFFGDRLSESLRSAAQEVLSESYFESLYFFGSTTNMAGAAYYTIKTWETLGPLRSGFIACMAHEGARRFATEIEQRGHKVWEVRNNTAIVELRDGDEVNEVKNKLYLDHDLDVASVSSCGNGLRLVFNLDQYLTPFSCSSLVSAVDDSIRAVRGEKRPRLRRFDLSITDWPKCLLVEREHLFEIRKRYARSVNETSPQEERAYREKSSKNDDFARALDLFGEIEMRYRLRTEFLVRALQNLHDCQRFEFSFEWFSKLSGVQQLVQAFRDANKHPRGGKEGQFWQKLLFEEARKIEAAARYFKVPVRCDRPQVFGKLCRSIAHCDETLHQSYIESFTPIPRLHVVERLQKPD